MKKNLNYIIIIILTLLVWLFFYKNSSQNETLTPIKLGNKYGYKNQNGKIIIKPKYKQAFEFYKDKALVQYCNNQDECHVDIINKKGKRLNKQKIVSNLDFFNDLAVASVNNKYGYIDNKGNFVIKPIYEVAFEFSDNIVPVAIYDFSRRCNLWGYINIKGDTVIPFQFFEANYFVDNIAIVKTMLGYNIINKDGKILCKQNFFSDMPPTTKNKKIYTYKTYSNWPFDNHTDVIELDCNCNIIKQYAYTSD